MVTNLHGEDYNENILQTSHNNIIVTFKPSDTYNTPNYAIIEIFNHVFKIYPNPQDEFYFNLKPIIKNHVLKQNNEFRDVDTNDQLQNNPSPNDLKKDTNLVLSENYKITVNMSISRDEVVYKDIYFIRGVRDYITKNDLQYKLGDIDASNDRVFILHPKKVKMYEGYPFDIYILKNQAQNIRYEFSTDAAKFFDLSDPKPLNCQKLTLSTGDFEIMTGTTPVIEKGVVNNLRVIDLATGTTDSIKIEHIQNKCGHYFKWVSDRSVYHFLMYDNAEYIRNSKSIGRINQDFGNINTGSYSPTKSIGRESSDSLLVIARKTDAFDREILRSLTTSPKIYYYLGEKGERSADEKWIEVELADHSFPIKNLNKKKFDIEFEFKFPDNPHLNI